MADINLNSLTNKALSVGSGYLFGIDESGGSVSGFKMPVTDVKAASDLAATALQPAAVADMAYEDPADWVPRSEYDADLATLAATNAFLQAQIEELQGLIGVGSIAVYETDVYEPGVYA
jgi:hypothetical protein